ncbi:MAG: OmpA family protein, partial [Bacteroidota bacterium]
LLACTIVACVPRDQYNAALTELNYYRSASEKADSLEAIEAISTYNTTGSAELELQRRIQQVESLTATNISLNSSFKDLRSRYDDLLKQNKELLSASGEQVTSLQESLADRAAIVSEQEQSIRQKEIELQAREQQLAQLEASMATRGADNPNPYGGPAPSSYGNTPIALSETQNSALRQNQLQNQLAQTLVGYPRQAVYTNRIGSNQVAITIAQNQLFADGFILSANGRSLLQRIAVSLQAYPDAEVKVVGHSDASVDAISAYENSTDRAIAIAENLIGHGVNPRAILAAGQGYYNPIAPNTTATEMAQNRRTDIIITLPQ